jgi:uncharacterized protein (DUF305 family)
MPLRHRAILNWRAAAQLGLITSTFSTIVSQLLAGRLGRDAAVDWMVVASIPLQGWGVQAEPSWWVILAGILFHQTADFLWALAFFGLLGRWTARLSPRSILLLALPWAIFTSATEYFVIVAYWQPIFTLEQPYWIGLLVHMTSAWLYPLFPWLRERAAGHAIAAHTRFARRWAMISVTAILGMAVLAFLGSQAREWPPHLGNAAYDQAYMRRMAAHHAQGMALARLATTRGTEPGLRSVARLMVAAQAGDITIFRQWHRSWFGHDLPPATPADHATMPGMLTPAQFAMLERRQGREFDPLFVALMSHHHRGAIDMADEAMRQAGDPRLRVMAHAIRHAQRGEILLMRGIARGPDVAAAAASALLAPAGTGEADQPRDQGIPGAHDSSH